MSSLQSILILSVYFCSYITSSSLLSNSKTCTSEECHVICDKSKSCESMSIDASKASSLHIECSESQSCAKLRLTKGPTDSVTIKCTAPKACSDASFSFSTTTNAYIECRYNATDDTTSGTCINAQFYGEYTTDISVDCNGLDCYQSVFHVNSSETAEFTMHDPSTHSYTKTTIFGSHITNALLLKCLHSNSCRENSIYCPDQGDCVLQCDGDFACALKIYMNDKDQHLYVNTTSGGAIYDTDFYCLDSGHMSIMKYQGDRKSWGCEEYTQKCCPTISTWGTTVTSCATHSDCQVKCTPDEPCFDIINATDVASLSVECIGDHSCVGKEIDCPVGGSSSCKVLCNGVDACKDSTIHISSMGVLDVLCVDELSCHALSIWPSSQFERPNIDTVSLLCEKSGSCQNVTFGYGVTVGSMNIECTGYKGCQSVQFAEDFPVVGYSYGYIATVIENSLTINCVASMACNRMKVNLISSATANNNIICNNPSVSDAKHGACYASSFNLYGITKGVGDWSVSCNTFDCQSAAFLFDAYSPRQPSNSLSANCYGSNSCLEARFNGESANHMDLQCRSNRSCHQAVVRGPSYAASATNVVCGAADNVCSGMTIASRWQYTADYIILKCPSRDIVTSPCDGITMECDWNYRPYIFNPQTCYLHYDKNAETYDGCVDKVNGSSLVSGEKYVYCCPIQEQYEIQSTIELGSVLHDDGKKSNNTVIVVGVIGGSILVAVLIGVIAWCSCVSTQQKRRNNASALLSEQIGDFPQEKTQGVVDVESVPYVPPTKANGTGDETEMSVQ